MAQDSVVRSTRRSRSRWAGLIAVLVAALLAVGALVASAGADHTPTSKDIPNLGQVKTSIKLYYGDYVDANGDHQASPTSTYATEVAGVEANGLRYVDRKEKNTAGQRAVVFDVDDTTLLTYNYEAKFDFAYIPAENARYVLGEQFPAVFGMPAVVDAFKAQGYAIFFITGRPNAQHTATLGNLAKVGYPAPTAPTTGEDGLYTKPDSVNGTVTYPSYVDCTTDGIPACSTTEYKASTRKHIESLGYTIIGNFGDQPSDLAGGYARVSLKMPNPMYYLP